MFSKQKHNKLTKREYDTLNSLFTRINPPCQNTLYNSGEHYELWLIMRDMGFKPPKNAIDVYDMASKALSLGYE